MFDVNMPSNIGPLDCSVVAVRTTVGLLACVSHVMSLEISLVVELFAADRALEMHPRRVRLQNR